MAHALAQLKHEWQAFKHDDPGERFQHHRKRMQQRSRAMRITSYVLAVILLVGGIVFGLMPVIPGVPFIVFGLALLGARWHWLARLLDRAETWLRHLYRRIKQRLKRRREHSY